MAKISNTGAYPNITNLDSADYIIITDKENTLMTKTCTIGTLQTFLDSSGVAVATATTVGGSKLVTDTEQPKVFSAVTDVTGRTYGVQQNSDKQMVVNVPWVSTSNTLTATGSSGDATLSSGVLNIPNYGTNQGSPVIAVFKLSLTGVSLTGGAFVNNFGGTWTFSRIGAGDYIATNTSVTLNGAYVMAFVTNPNVTQSPNGAGAGVYPESTIVDVKTSTQMKILNYDLSTTGLGIPKDFGSQPVWVEVRQYPL